MIERCGSDMLVEEEKEQGVNVGERQLIYLEKTGHVTLAPLALRPYPSALYSHSPVLGIEGLA